MRAKRAMEVWEFNRYIEGKMYHRVILTLQNGSVVDAYIQPNDNRYVYLTTHSGQTAGKILIEDIINIEFPDN